MSTNSLSVECGALRFYKENKTTRQLCPLFKNKTYTVGSSRLTSIRLPGKSTCLKPMHFKIETDIEGHAILAVIESNDVVLNGIKITAETLLHPGDVINIFGNIIKYENDDLISRDTTDTHVKVEMNIKRKENVPLKRRTICISSSMRNSSYNQQLREDDTSTQSTSEDWVVDTKTPLSRSSKRLQTSKLLQERKPLFKTPQSCKITKIKSIPSSRKTRSKSAIKEIANTTPNQFNIKRKLSLNFIDEKERRNSKRKSYSLQSLYLETSRSSFNNENPVNMDSSSLTLYNNFEIEDATQFEETSIPETPAKLFSEDEDISHISLKPINISSTNSSNFPTSQTRRSTRISLQKQAKLYDLNSPEKSILDNSVKESEGEPLNISGISKLQQTPERKTSPINLPNINNSKQKKIKSPKNDLSNVHGIKKLMKTPKVMKTPHNDLTNIPNLRNLIFPRKAGCPNDDLTDVKGVKQLFMGKEKSPKNDLRNIYGIKKLMSTPKDQQSPNNDLTRVPNLRNLIYPKIDSSPNNDLTNVDGVDQLFTNKIKSPKNDSTNIRVLKKLMKTPKIRRTPKNDSTNIPNLRNLMSPKKVSSPVNDLTDVRGVKQLFTGKQMPAVNDLSNIYGVKKLMSTPKIRRTPKNDLTNVPNLRSFIFPKKVCTPFNDLTNIEGIDKLFNEYENDINNTELATEQNLKDLSNSEFDLLLDKKPLRQYRGKSVSPKKMSAPSTLKRKTLGDIPKCSLHVATWVEEQKNHVKIGFAQNENNPIKRGEKARSENRNEDRLAQTTREIVENKSNKRKTQDTDISDREQETRISSTKKPKLSNRNDNANIRMTRSYKKKMEGDTINEDLGRDNSSKKTRRKKNVSVKQNLETQQNDTNTSGSNLERDVKNSWSRTTRSRKQISIEDNLNTPKQINTDSSELNTEADVAEANTKQSRSKRKVSAKENLNIPIEFEVRKTRGNKKNYVDENLNASKGEKADSVSRESNLETDAAEFEARKTKHRKNISTEVNLNTPKYKTDTLSQELEIGTDTPRKTRNKKHVIVKENMKTPIEDDALSEEANQTAVINIQKKTRGKKTISVEKTVNTFNTPKKTRGRKRTTSEKNIDVSSEKKGENNICVDGNMDTSKQNDVNIQETVDTNNTSKKTRGRKRTIPEESMDASSEKQQRGNSRKLRKSESTASPCNNTSEISPKMILRRSKRNK